jgi:hypothetical protein
LRWQLEDPSSGHSKSGSVPTLTGPHTPLPPDAFLAAAHVWHVPLQGLSQQKPSMQLPLEHWLALVQVAPLVWSG